MIKVGRYTAALLLVTVGACLLLDQSLDTHFMEKLSRWWPFVLIVLGLEFILVHYMNRSGERKVVLGFGGLFLAVLVSAIIIGVSQGSLLSTKFTDNFNLGSFSFSDDNGPKFDKGVTSIPLDASTNKVILENLNGTIDIVPGNVETIEITTTVRVSLKDHKEASAIAERSTIEYTEGSTMKITAKGQEYRSWFGKRKPRMNLQIIVPSNREVDLEILMRNGSFAAEGLPIKDEFKLKTTNGSVTLAKINGNVIADTTNGGIKVSAIEGETTLDTTNGTITAADIDGNLSIDSTNGALNVRNVKGNVTMETSNGSIVIADILGDVEAETTNGRITVDDVQHNIDATSTNGSILVSNQTIDGDWDLDTSNGKIELALPTEGNYKISGSSGGSISSELPLQISKRHIEGIVGNGQYMVELNTNGSIIVNKY